MLVLSVLGLAACAPRREGTPGSFLVRGALLVDGSGAPPSVGSVRVRGDRIEAVGDLAPDAGETVIDASGLVLAPGFIDTHSHHDEGLLDEPAALAAVSQGITTIVAGQDGGSQHPLRGFFGGLESQPAAINVASFSGHGSLRAQVLGDDFRRAATPGEVTRMAELLQQDLDAGALGLSTGLEYDPGIYSETAEVVELARVAAAAGGRYISHVRSEDRHFFAAIEEAIEIGRTAGIPVQISHLKLAMVSLWGQSERLLEMLDAARAEGVEVSADVYPYEYWHSTMTVLFPERDFEDLEESRMVLREITTPEGVVVARFDPEPSYVGKTLAEIARQRGREAAAVLLELIAESQAAADDPLDPPESIIATSMTTEDVDRLLAWPHSNVCTDGSLDGRHPRGFGTYPKVLGDLVRERGVLALEEAVRKMTSLAAAHMGLPERGRIEPGAFADLVLFDAARVEARATPTDPHATAAGIERVWVNGVEVYREGAVTGEHPGRVLRRTPP